MKLINNNQLNYLEKELYYSSSTSKEINKRLHMGYIQKLQN